MIQSHAEAELVAATVDHCLQSVREMLLRRHGWTRLDPVVAIDRRTRIVYVSGNVLVAAVVRHVDAALRRVAPPGWQVITTMRATDAGRWMALASPVTRLWRECCDNASSPTLATELIPSDGPVRLLGRRGSSVLIRALDGTVGWTVDALRTATALPAPPRRRGVEELIRAWLGVPYLHGGTTSRGVDCSGLTQRFYREMCGAVIPRHSRDQWPFERSNSRRRTGDLVVLKTDADTHHVGIAVCRRGGDWTVVHASSSRGRVVEDPL